MCEPRRTGKVTMNLSANANSTAKTTRPTTTRPSGGKRAFSSVACAAEEATASAALNPKTRAGGVRHQARRVPVDNGTDVMRSPPSRPSTHSQSAG